MSALEQGYPIFECGGVCGWPQRFWLRNKKAKFYCAKCQKPCAIKLFPDVDHWPLWDDWMWDTHGKISDHVQVFHDEVIDHHEFEGTSQRQIWSEFSWDRVEYG